MKIDDEVMECVKELIYLKEKSGDYPYHEKEFKRRIGMAEVHLVGNTML